jgi:hypothetical protein
MTTTETIRSQGFMPLESDIPAGVTLAQWRAGQHPTRISRRPLLRRRRAQRPVAAA